MPLTRSIQDQCLRYYDTLVSDNIFDEFMICLVPEKNVGNKEKNDNLFSLCFLKLGFPVSLTWFDFGKHLKIVENHSSSQSLTWESQPLPAYQYFENVRNFLVAVEELKLPAFEASDLERVNKFVFVYILSSKLGFDSCFYYLGYFGGWLCS